MSLQQEGDDGCLGLFLASLLTSWQSSGYTIMGSTVVVPVRGSLRSGDG